MTEIDRLLELATAEPAAAVGRATKLLDEDLTSADRSRVLRALTLARTYLGEIHEAVTSGRDAVAVARDGDDTEALGLALTTQAGVLAWAGEPVASIEAIDEALALLEAEAYAKALAQRGGIHYRLGNFTLALSDLNEAIGLLHEPDQLVWKGHALTNRGLLHAYQGSLDLAKDDLGAARRAYGAVNQRSAEARAAQNLGWLALRSGDLPGALNYLDEAEGVIADLGASLGQVWADRAEALLAAHMAADAKQVALKAAQELKASGLNASYADALLQAAQAALLGGHNGEAIEAARKARTLLEGQGRDGWVAFADYIVMRARAVSGDLGGDDLPAIRRSVAALDRAGLQTESIHARLLAAEVATAVGDFESCRRYLEEAAEARRAGPVEIRAQGWVALARLRAHAEDSRGTAAAARAGLEVLDRYQATLGGTLARLHVSGHGAELAEIGVKLAAESGSPRRLFEWLERTRAGALRNQPVSTVRDDDLAAHLLLLREADEELRRATLEGADADALWRRRNQLQEKVRDISMRSAGHGGGRIPRMSAGDTLDLLDHAALVEFGVLPGEDLVAVVLREGRARKVALGPLSAVRREVDSLAMSIRRLARRNASEASRQAGLAVVREAAENLNRVVIEPLRLESETVVIIPTGVLASTPWALLSSLRESAIAVAPSAALWAAATRQGAPAPTGRAAVVAGPNLEHAVAEVERVAALYRNPLPLVEPTAAEAAGAIDGAAMAHVACHGTLRADNPLFSSLEMADAGLTIYDLESLVTAPSTMVLSACDAGANVSAGGQEVMGLATALLSQGTQSVVANVGLVPDQASTIDLMERLHRGIAAGVPVSRALADALPPLDFDDPAAIAARAFVTFGA